MFRRYWILPAIGCLIITLSGCNTDPLFARDKQRMGPVALPGPAVKGVPVGLPPTQQEEQFIENVAFDRGRYFEILLKLRAGYRAKGDHIKLRWAEQEIRDLRAIEAFADVPIDSARADVQEVDLVEELLVTRQAYHRSLETLHQYYGRQNDPAKLQWVDEEIAAARKIQAFKYFHDADIPGEWLRPTESIPAADALFDRAYARLREGGHGVPALYREDVMLDALDMFTRMIRQHPTSDKIDDAAFYCGEIHKEYLKYQDDIAVKWYERAIEWDPRTPHAARFQAAVVYDFRMHDRARALELYHEVLKRERFNRSNVSFAERRIKQLTGELESTGRRPPA